MLPASPRVEGQTLQIAFYRRVVFRKKRSILSKVSTFVLDKGVAASSSSVMTGCLYTQNQRLPSSGYLSARYPSMGLSIMNFCSRSSTGRSSFILCFHGK